MGKTVSYIGCIKTKWSVSLWLFWW